MYQIDREKLVWRNVDDEMIILNLEKATYYILNEVARSIWETLSEGKNAREAAEKLVQFFKIDFATALADTEEYIELLQNNELLISGETKG